MFEDFTFKDLLDESEDRASESTKDQIFKGDAAPDNKLCTDCVTAVI